MIPALAFELELEVMGTYPLGFRDTDAATRSFQDRDLDELDVAYGKWADRDFPPSPTARSWTYMAWTT